MISLKQMAEITNSAQILAGFIILWLAIGVATWMSRWSHQARQDRRDAARWRRLMMYRKDLDAEDLGQAIIRARFDEECG